jgi:hypothetical protein
MRQLVLFVIIAGLLAACAAPPANQPATGQDLPEVTVFRSPT